MERRVTLPSDIEICYETFGDPQAEPLMLVMGLSGPMTWWDRELCEQYVDAGFFVVRYDNRDTGYSSRLSQQLFGRKDLVKAFFGRPVRAAYTLANMADDLAGLMDHLGIASAHIKGMSMGGMIAQTFALAYPERTRTLTSVMSTTGRRSVGWQDPALLPRLLRRPPRTEQEYLDSSARFWKLIGSPGYPTPPSVLLQRGRETWERGVNPAGSVRQMIAVLTQPDRTEALGRLAVPTLVIHGLRDRMVHVSGGRATARAIPGARLLVVPEMGHDLPPSLFPHYVNAVREVADLSRR